MTGLYAPPTVTTSQRDLAQKILNAVGKILWCNDEAQLDAITAISGSGPAYVFYFIEALQEAASALGFSEETAHELVMQTMIGSTHLAAHSNETPVTLRNRVTSKGGTTAAAIASFDQDELKALILRGVEAALIRSRELSKT